MFRLPSIYLIALLMTACGASPATDPLLLEAVRWYTGEAGSVDDARARSLLERAAADGDALSVMWLARVYSTGRMTYPADKARAIELASGVIDDIEAMAAADVAEAAFLLGTAYAEGLGKSVDPTTAVIWYRRAAELGNTLAIHNVGNSYAAGIGVPQNDAQAIEWWLQAANKGDAIPQLRLGEMFEQGRGIEKDLRQAMRWYGEAAQRGNRNAAEALSRIRAD